MDVKDYSRLAYSTYEKLRDESNLKDADIARRIGVPRAYISQWKHGKAFPKIDKIVNIADLFQVSLDFMFQRERD